MREHVRLGRVAGINVGINWSVLAIFMLITFGLAAGRFPLLYPDLSRGVYTAAGLAAGVVFFLSLLAHEVSHAVVAKRNGVGVEGITLWMFGGVAHLTGEARDPSADLRIAGVGPLVSAVLAVMFFAVTAALTALDLPGIVVGVFAWLALINAVLAVFNLVPAAPLDGGRILRALLWRRRKDRLSAAITATRAGQAFGWFLVLGGLAQLLLFAGFGGVWLMLIGWFLTTAAEAEEQHARVTGVLSDVQVRDVMSADPTVAPSSISVEAFLNDYVFPNRYSTFPLTENGGRPVGLVTLNRVKAVPADQRGSTLIGAVACPLDEVPMVAPEDPLAELLPRLSGCTDGRALVVEDGRVVGLVSPTDVMRQVEISQLRHPARSGTR